jgi:SnoaL-like domain
MENHIIETISAIFNGADERNWAKIENSFADQVLLDYTSMAGGEPTVVTPQQITTAWKGLLPGFDRTLHKIGNFQINQNTVHFTGNAEHFIGSEKWIVEGTYDISFEKIGDNIKVTAFKFNFEKQSGNTNLPAKAMEIIKKQL